MTKQERHNYLLRKVISSSGCSEINKRSHDIDVIKEHHRFLWNSEESPKKKTWEMRLARRYYDKLFKEYCVADLTRYKDNKVALRWRTRDEVIAGKGQFQCGSRKCDERENLRSWEVNFAYTERGERKNSLVKLRLCRLHSDQLNYTSRKREAKRLKKSVQHGKNKDYGINMSGEAKNYMKSRSSLAEENISRTTGPDEKTLENGTIWNRKLDPVKEITSRETEFEYYLEDLLI
ncbi:protein FRA10AC1 homolog [Eurosta solidaginis]|uniref:protein FRA10AC1 homolog n=1 Tax=Eurosta solidaginis TaxID=178769 RepID=UPI003531529F